MANVSLGQPNKVSSFDLIVGFGHRGYKIMGKGQNYEFHNVKNQKEHRKSWRQSQHRKALLKQSERRKRKRSEHRKANNHNVKK